MVSDNASRSCGGAGVADLVAVWFPILNIELGIVLNREITKCPFFFERGDVFGVYLPFDDFDDDRPLLRPLCDVLPRELDLLELDFRELEREELDLDLLRPRCCFSCRFGDLCLLFLCDDFDDLLLPLLEDL